MKKKRELQPPKPSPGMFVDMHFHTIYSDGTARIKSIKSKCDKKQIWVAITDHNEIEGAVRAYKAGIPLIPAIEVRPTEGHDILLYFNSINDLMDFFYKYVKPSRKKTMKYAPLSMSTSELIKNSRKYSVLISLAHPFGLLHNVGIKRSKTGYRPVSAKDREILKQVDAIEVRNSHILTKSNEEAQLLANKLKKPFTGGSDGHALFDLGKVLTYAGAKTPEQFLNAVRSQKNEIYESEKKLRKIVFSRSLALRKHIIHPLYYTHSFLKKLIRKFNPRST